MQSDENRLSLKLRRFYFEICVIILKRIYMQINVFLYVFRNIFEKGV